MVVITLVLCGAGTAVAAKRARPPASDDLKALMGAADDAMIAKDWRAASTKLEAALAQARKDGDQDRVDDILGELVKAYYAQGEIKAAYERQRELLDHVLEDNQPLPSAVAALQTAILAARVKLYKEADRQLDYAQVLFSEAGRTAELAKVAQYQAVVAADRRDYERAVARFQAARELYQKVGDAGEAAARLLDLANADKELLNKYDSALALYDQAIRELTAAGLPERANAARIDQGNTLVELGEPQAAVALLTTTRAKIPPRKDPVGWIRATQMLAKARYRTGDYAAATALINAVTSALPAVADAATRAGLEIDGINLRAMLTAELGQYDAAFADFDAALKIAKESNLPAKEAYLRNNRGYWLRESGHAADALDEHEKALAIDTEANAQDGIAYDLRNLGLARTAMGEYDQAATLLADALKKSLEIGGAYNIAYCHLGLGELRVAQNDWAAAEAEFDEALKLATAHHLAGFEWQAEAGLGEAARGRGQTEAGTLHLHRALALIEGFEATLKSDLARREFKGAPRVARVYGQLEGLLRQAHRIQEADAVHERAQPRLIGRVPTM
jgi:tetratricopeptide (TPR) repeat protein